MNEGLHWYGGEMALRYKKTLSGVMTAVTLSMGVHAYAASTDAAYESAQNRNYRSPYSSVEVRQPARNEPSEKNYIENEEIFQVASMLNVSHSSPDYRLYKGDSVSVSVVGFPNGVGLKGLTNSSGTLTAGTDGFTVGQDGYVQLPYVGSVKFEGLTLDEARDVLMDSLGRYIRIPDMSLAITNYGPRQVYVMGQVKTPGLVELDSNSMNAYAALAAAGGWTSKGRSTRVQIIRLVDDVMYWRRLDMKKYINGHDMTQNVVAEAGDIIYVPDTDGINLTTDIMPWFTAWAVVKNVTD